MPSQAIAQFTAHVGMGHRRAHSQFFTPPQIADFMCRWVMKFGPSEVYDPSFGLGAFFLAAREINPGVRFVASEIDERVLDFFLQQHQVTSASLCVRCEDYLTVWGQQHDAIVCNPPYKKFQHFANRDTVFEAFNKQLSCRLSGYTNSASAFLTKSLSELAPGGRLAYLMPLEFLNTGYGAEIKRRLLQGGLLKALVRIDAEKDAFPEATTSLGVVLVHNDGNLSPVRFYVASRMNELGILLATEPIRELSHEKLVPAEKWIRHFDPRVSSVSSGNLVRLDTYGTFSRGIATGANDYFAMSRVEATKRALPRSLFLRCITKSAQITRPIFTEADLDALEASGAPIYLLNLADPLEPAASAYVKYGEGQGYHQRYLTRVRNPWYRLERRVPAPLLFGVFSRNRFKAIRNHSSAIHLTCFHGFYPNLFGQGLLDHLFIYFQSRAARRLLQLNMRRYGDALDKFEPNDLNHALAPSEDWFARLPGDVLDAGLSSCRLGNELPETVDRYFDELLAAT